MLIPLPGDVVRITEPYYDPGRAVIDGHAWGWRWNEPGDQPDTFHPHIVGEYPTVMATRRASAFRGCNVERRDCAHRHEYVSCSGGPCPFVPVRELVWIGVVTQEFWRWRSMPEAGGGVPYVRTVNCWRWTPRSR